MGDRRSVPRILLVGATSALYEKKVRATVGLGDQRLRRPSRVLSFIFTAILAGLLWGASHAEAQTASPAAPTTWALRIAEGSRCEDSRAFAATLTGQIPLAQRATEDRAELVAEVSVGAEGQAHIRVFDRVLQAEAGARELKLTTEECDDIAKALALVLAVLVEAGRGSVATAQASAPAPPPAPPPPEEPPPLPPPPSKPSPPRSRVRHAWLGPRAGHDLSASFGINVGLLPDPAIGVTAGWGIRPASTWPIWFQATGWTAEQSSDRHAKFRAVYGGVLTCPLSTAWNRLRLRACAGFAAGALSAEGRGLASQSRSSRVLPLVGVELSGSVRLVGPLAFGAIARADASLVRPRFFYYRADGETPELHQPTVVMGSFFAGPVLHFR